MENGAERRRRAQEAERRQYENSDVVRARKEAQRMREDILTAIMASKKARQVGPK